MAKKNQKNKAVKSEPKLEMEKLSPETRSIIWGVIFVVLGLLVFLSVFGIAGVVGNSIYQGLHPLLGFGYYLFPIGLVLLGISFLKKDKPKVASLNVIFGTLIFLSLLGIFDVVANGNGGPDNIVVGGHVGNVVSWPFVRFFGIYAGILLLGAILVISTIVISKDKPRVGLLFQKIWNFLKSKFQKKETEDFKIEEVVKKIEEEKKEEKIVEPKIEEIEKKDPEMVNKAVTKALKQDTDYVPPPLSLLERNKGKPDTGDMKGNMNMIQKTLMTFGIPVEMADVTIGPTVTRYSLKPAQGVKLSRIVGLQNELALALSAKSIRIEAPIPGKSLVGIEVPNKEKATVGLATLLEDKAFQESPKPLTVALGRGLSGKAIFGNLAKMPHLLVAGTTGSGKSVTIHSIINSLLYRNGPQDMKFIMVDPKRVELTLYNKIPHLLTPVITQPKQTILALKWAAREMDRRYDILQAESVQNIESYHENVYEKAKKKGIEAERLPYIVIVIDELADIMQTYPRELESAIVRLAQMSRAVGIHLILSTQRPSVNVITGLIKANIPTRIALQVSSQIDSRTILDQGGAEKLLGAGDMLYACAESPTPERLQSAFVSEVEVKRVVEYLKKLFIDEIPSQIDLSGSIDKGGSSLYSDDFGGDESGEDDLYEDARMIVIEAGKASTSYLQRKLGIGYARAAKLMDMLEERGIIGAANGAKPREVLEKPVDHTSGISEPLQNNQEEDN